MKNLSQVTMRHFRNLTEETLALGDRVTILSGKNGQGKTSTLEAIHLLSTGRLIRPGRDGDAVQHGSSAARVEGVMTHGVTLAVELRAGQKKRAFLNGGSLPRASDLLGTVPSVSFSATDLTLVTGEPADRRLFLDAEISQISPAYLRHLTVYQRALKQRNVLLRHAAEGGWADEASLAIWEEQMAEHGSVLRQIRAEWVAELAPLASHAHAALGDGEELTLDYERSDPSETAEALLELYSTLRKQELVRGTTLKGPHRDDLALRVRQKDARLYGSQGQQRTCVISLKVATLQLSTARLGAPPILLLDDVFSDLDVFRRGHLIALALEQAGQVVLTCTEAEQAGTALLKSALVYRVQDGTLSPA